MIPTTLLLGTGGHGQGYATYAGPGHKKTLAIHTLPPPIELHELEGNIIPLLPWVRRVRRWDQKEWEPVTQAFRELQASRIDKSVTPSPVKPSPFIDVISYDSMNPNCYNPLVANIASFDYNHYNSIAIDSMQEFSIETQSFTKVQEGGNAAEPMELKFWGGAQERAAIMIRRLRSHRQNHNVFVYMTGGEDIEKDYAEDPRSQIGKSGPKVQSEPYLVKGTMMVPGKLTGTIAHSVNGLFHGRLINGEIVWVTQPEPISGASGKAHWEAKDSTGRLPKYVRPNFREILKHIYGEETRNAIYEHGFEMVSTSEVK